MKKLLLILLCVPLIFSCGEKEEKNEEKDNKTENTEKNDVDNLLREITQEMIDDGYTGKGTYTWGYWRKIRRRIQGW